MQLTQELTELMTLTSTNRRPVVIYPRHSQANLPHSTFGSVFSQPYPSPSKSWGPQPQFYIDQNTHAFHCHFLTTFVHVINIKKGICVLISVKATDKMGEWTNYRFCFFTSSKEKKGRERNISCTWKGVFVNRWRT